MTKGVARVYRAVQCFAIFSVLFTVTLLVLASSVSARDAKPAKDAKPIYVPGLAMLAIVKGPVQNSYEFFEGTTKISINSVLFKGKGLYSDLCVTLRSKIEFLKVGDGGFYNSVIHVFGTIPSGEENDPPIRVDFQTEVELLIVRTETKIYFLCPPPSPPSF